MTTGNETGLLGEILLEVLAVVLVNFPCHEFTDFACDVSYSKQKVDVSQ